MGTFEQGPRCRFKIIFQSEKTYERKKRVLAATIFVIQCNSVIIRAGSATRLKKNKSISSEAYAGVRDWRHHIGGVIEWQRVVVHIFQFYFSNIYILQQNSSKTLPSKVGYLLHLTVACPVMRDVNKT